jgi:hypothetical protein
MSLPCMLSNGPHSRVTIQFGPSIIYLTFSGPRIKGRHNLRQDELLRQHGDGSESAGTAAGYGARQPGNLKPISHGLRGPGATSSRCGNRCHRSQRITRLIAYASSRALPTRDSASQLAFGAHRNKGAHAAKSLVIGSSEPLNSGQ